MVNNTVKLNIWKATVRDRVKRKKDEHTKIVVRGKEVRTLPIKATSQYGHQRSQRLQDVSVVIEGK